MSLKNIFYKLAHDVSRYPNIVQLTNTLDHGFKEVAEHIQDGGSEVEVTPVYTSGEKLATITVDGDDNDIYMPDGEVKTMTGTSFKTVNGSLVDEMKIGFAPIQDLHGYSKPWPGGAGKNLCTYNGTNNSVIGHCENGVVYTFSCKYIESSGANLKKNDSSGATITVIAGSAGQTSVYTFVADEDFDLFLNGYSGFTTKVIELQLEKGSTATSYEPYSNICPFTGHTQVQSEINNTTNTTSLGGTEYDGEVDQVSGSGVSNFKSIVFDGSIDENIVSLDSPKRYGIDIPNDSITMSSAPQQLNGFICNEYAEITDEQGRNGIVGFHLRNNGSHSILVCMGADAPATIADFRTWLSNNNLQLLYKLATPTTLSLTGQNIVADVGVNEVSAPLTGQSIEEVKYHQMMTIQDVEKLTE